VLGENVAAVLLEILALIGQEVTAKFNRILKKDYPKATWMYYR